MTDPDSYPSPSDDGLPPGTRTLRPRSAPRTSSIGRGCLFDRLQSRPAHSAPEMQGLRNSVESRALRQAVLRDLSSLLNATNGADWLDPDQYPDAAASSLNFGVAPLAGSPLVRSSWNLVESHIRRAIEKFEPRLIRESLRISPLSNSKESSTGSLLNFEIHALIWNRPSNLELIVHSSVDLESRRIHVEAPRGEAR